ncbi:MAG: dihydrofolate reductase family protein [Anaerolineaceae bacterium]|nr:dihydrofolate reductase family protein [Anaerolineaceae bacterium]
MRKIIAFCHLSLDGIAAVPDGSLSWIPYNEELEKWAEPIVKATDTAVYGRVTYELMKYWQTVPSNPESTQHELEHARWIEAVEKIVVSKSMKVPDWNNTKIVNKDLQETFTRMKETPGENITIFGSPTLANTLIKLGLVDEYQLSVSPVVLGSGKFLFSDLKDAIQLTLMEERKLSSGVVTLHYAAK